MFNDLSRNDRMLLLKFVCSVAWADLEIKDSERNFVLRLVGRLELGDDEKAQVEEWLHTAPAPDSVSPDKVPAEHRRVFIEAARAVMYADGDIDEEERAQLDKLKAALST